MAWLQAGLLIFAILVTAPLLGRYLALVFSGGDAPGDRMFRPVERFVYRFCDVDEQREQDWASYARALLAFSAVGVLGLYLLLRLQGVLFFNPTGARGMDPVLSFNTAVSFVTNTNWQNYAGDTAVSHLTQMTGLAVQNFASAAVGMAVAVALVRGMVRKESSSIGNFWVDIVRAITRVLIPLSLLVALALGSQGVIQNLHGPTPAITSTGSTQTIPGGPVAGQEAIKDLGTNGGGFFNANSAHPFENPTGATDLLEIWALLIIPFALTLMFGRMAGDRRQGWALFAAVFAIWIGFAAIATHYETAGNPTQHALGALGPNMEGKEVRFGAPASALFATSTTGTSAGAVNSMHDSFTPLGGGASLVHMMLGEVTPGGVGAGLYGILVFVLLTVFLIGLMVGRTPEFLGKKIQATEMKLITLYLLVTPMLVLGFASVSTALSGPRSSMHNPGAHGLSEIVYAFTSAANNNGSAFAGIAGDTDWFNITLALAMFAGRFIPIVIVLAIAGSLARRPTVPRTAGTLPTNTPTFAVLLASVVLVVVGLTYAPVVSLGPVIEHLKLQ